MFYSNREKWFWIGALAVLLGISATLIIDRPFRDLIKSQDVDAILFLYGMFMWGLAAFFHGIRRKTSVLEVWVVVGLMCVYFMVFFRMTLPTERSHLIEYGILALFVWEALRERQKFQKKLKWIGMWTILICTCVGVIDEVLQLFIPNRVFDFQDIFFDGMAASLAVGGSELMKWTRNKIAKSKTLI